MCVCVCMCACVCALQCAATVIVAPMCCHARTKALLACPCPVPPHTPPQPTFMYLRYRANAIQKWNTRCREKAPMLQGWWGHKGAVVRSESCSMVPCSLGICKGPDVGAPDAQGAHLLPLASLQGPSLLPFQRCTCCTPPDIRARSITATMTAPLPPPSNLPSHVCTLVCPSPAVRASSN